MRRTCIGCRKVTGPDELYRVVRTPDGLLEIGRVLRGRGAWLCRDSVSCVDQAARRGAFGRALRGPVTDEAVRRLRAVVTERARMDNRHTNR